MSSSGANIPITGATSGSGLEREVPDASLRPMVGDLASMASIERLLAAVDAEFASIDLLFNDAAVMKRERTLT